MNSSSGIPPPGPAAEDIASVVVLGNLILVEEPYPPVVRVVSECGSEASALARVVCDLQVVLCKVLVYSFSWEKPRRDLIRPSACQLGRGDFREPYPGSLLDLAPLCAP